MANQLTDQMTCSKSINLISYLYFIDYGSEQLSELANGHIDYSVTYDQQTSPQISQINGLIT